MSSLELLDAVAESVRASANLEKLASVTNDKGAREELNTLKIAVDAEVFKLASLGLGRKALTGLAYGAGAAAPAVAGGAYLLHRGSEEAAHATADVRNKVLQSALGLAGIGAGAYGLQRAFAPPEKRAALSADQNKADKAAKEELVEKLATVATIEDDLSRVNIAKLSKEAQDLSAQLRIVNRAYGVKLLQEAMEA